MMRLRLARPSLPARWRRRISAVGLTIAWASSPCVAHADPARPAPVEADALFTEGKEHLRSGDWSGACQRFERSFELDASVSVLVKIARCREHEGRPAAALAVYERALDLNGKLTRAPERVAELDVAIRAGMREVTAHVPRLRIVVSPAPADLVITVDGAAVTRTDPVPVDPGDHNIDARATGYRGVRVQVSVAEGEIRELRVVLSPQEPPAPDRISQPAQPASARLAESGPAPPHAPALATAEPSPEGANGQGQRIAAFTLGGAGIAALGVAGYFLWKTLSSIDISNSDGHCTTDTNGAKGCDKTGLDALSDARTARTAAIVAGSAGGALLVTATVLLVTAPSGRDGHRGPSLALSLEPLGASLRGSW
jgi:hypothetical protein